MFRTVGCRWGQSIRYGNGLKIPRTHKVHPGSIPGSGTSRGPTAVRPAISIPSVDRNA